MTYNKKVIPFPGVQSITWTFEDFVFPNGANPVENWCQQQSPEFQETFNSVLKDMQKTANHLNWGAWRRFLKGEAKKHKIWEIGFKCDGRQYRVLGIFSGHKLVILLAGCYHKGKVYTPHDAIGSAVKHASLLKEGKAVTRERKIRFDL